MNYSGERSGRSPFQCWLSVSQAALAATEQKGDRCDLALITLAKQKIAAPSSLCDLTQGGKTGAVLT